MKVTFPISTTRTTLAPSSKICRFFLNFFCHHKLLGFVDQYVLKMSMVYFVTKFKAST